MIRIIKKTLVNLFPKLVVSIIFYKHFHRFLNWKCPKDLNEKIQYLKFYSDTTLWTLCADKYRVREFVNSKGLNNILVDLYGKYDSFDEIEWKSLPSSFVMKLNNGSGDTLIIKDKSQIDIVSLESRFKKIMSSCFYNVNVEPHYKNIKPCIIIEELLDLTKQPIKTDSLIDYKIWCFNGKPMWIWVCFDRNRDSVKVALYDLDWQFHPEYSVSNKHYVLSDIDIPKPQSLKEMLAYASVLSEGFPQVRIDFYEIDGKPYFGEMTFTSAGGFMNFYTEDFLVKMGSLVDIS